VSDVGERKKQPHCGGGSGPKDALTIEEDGVFIDFWLRKMSFEDTDVNVDLPINYQAGNEYLVLGVEIGVEPGNFAIMHNQELRFFINSADSKKYKFNSFFWQYPKFYKSETVAHWGDYYTGIKFGEKLEVISELPAVRCHFGSEELPCPDKMGIIYRGAVWLDVDDADSVRMDQIEIGVNGRKIEIEHIDFTNKTDVSMYHMCGA
jgi:hypothetical protein